VPSSSTDANDGADPVDPGPLPNIDTTLRMRLAALSAEDPDFWNFAHGARREDAHGYYQYPAMMVPAMQRQLMRVILELQPGVESCLDVFAGSGTVLAEAMYFGLDVMGQDINPLAVLLCRAKAGPFRHEVLHRRAISLIARAVSDTGCSVEANFPGLSKWFRCQAVVELSRLRRAIRAERLQWVRRFLWVTLADTVRLTSNSRTSAFKLHIRPEIEIASLPSPIDTFSAILTRNLERHATFVQALEGARQLDRGSYRGKVACTLRDSRLPIEGSFDLLVTSPSYGDNTSTVPYGQSSYLPLQWVDLDDIDLAVTGADYLASTYEIDSRSLGGIKPRGDVMDLSTEMRNRSPSLHRTIEALIQQPHDRMARVFAFARDLEACLDPVLHSMRANAYLIWTVGNRRVGGVQVPLDAILKELLEAHGAVYVTTIDRRIPNKRMATRNSIAATMRAEHTLIFRRPANLSGSAVRMRELAKRATGDNRPRTPCFVR
jgi:hypothetical protein